MASILLIEDDELSRLTVRKFLESANHEVREARNGQQGIGLSEKQPFDLIITDIIMPVKEGISTIIELKAANPDQKIIVITGGGTLISKLNSGQDSGKEFYRDAAKQLGADYAILKPFTEDELLELVDRCLADAN